MTDFGYVILDTNLLMFMTIQACNGPGVGIGSLGWLVDFRAQIPWSEPPRMAVKMGGWVQNLKFSGCMTVSGLCMHDFGARASAPWKNFRCLLKFLLKKCYKCRVGSEKSESRGVGWLVD